MFFYCRIGELVIIKIDNFSDKDIEFDNVQGDVEVRRNLPLPQRGMIMRGGDRNKVMNFSLSGSESSFSK